MIFKISDDEAKKAQAIFEEYAQRISEAEAEADKHAPDEPKPDNPEDYEQWYASASEEWRTAKNKVLLLIIEQSNATKQYYESVFDEHFKSLGNNPDVIFKSATSEIDEYITDTYRKYEHMHTDGLDPAAEIPNVFTTDNVVAIQDRYFSACDVRATENGLLLDKDATMTNLLSVVSRHLNALKDDHKKIKGIHDYIVKAVTESPYISDSDGVLFGKIAIKKAYSGELVTRPKDYTTTVDLITRKLFANKLTRPLNARDGALWEVALDGAKGNAIARVAIDYKDIVKSGALSHLPELTAKHYILHDAIVTQILSGNRSMSYEMIYRAMIGKIKGKVTVPDDMIAFIDSALPLFNSRVQLKFSGKSASGDDLEIDFDEPLVTYSIGTAKINGRVIKKTVQIPEDTRFDPLLLKWARANGNEIDTRDITLLDVPGLNNGDESLLLKMCLYRRLIKMRNIFERVKNGKHDLPENQRIIRYDYIYSELHDALKSEDGTSVYQDPNKRKRQLLKDKVDRCLSYWKEKAFIYDYEHRRDKKAGNQYYAILISFTPTKEAEGTTLKSVTRLP